eukprot:CAMPEP_0182523456 /NCGR_PEP_ID=MMETSP1323-20130603/1066_1 /TAXON_ID=236787 /ORGANISM="Florenciella parvula, Strain RCC1693" /LENGTH=194 /DNA_ID=CAMNT_0024731825 /DNA_START=97 /DNA_END=682 /DNA_ORIENTATION=-
MSPSQPTHRGRRTAADALASCSQLATCDPEQYAIHRFRNDHEAAASASPLSPPRLHLRRSRSLWLTMVLIMSPPPPRVLLSPCIHTEQGTIATTVQEPSINLGRHTDAAASNFLAMARHHRRCWLSLVAESWYCTHAHKRTPLAEALSDRLLSVMVTFTAPAEAFLCWRCSLVIKRRAEVACMECNKTPALGAG